MSCFWCHSPQSQLCPRCGLVSSCSEHWPQHWSEDQKLCYPIKVAEDEILGRRIIAVRDIKQGEVIMEDRAVAVGPVHNTTPVCLQCYKFVSLDYCCDGCGYPMCDEECARGATHAQECAVFRSAGARVDIHPSDNDAVEYQVILVLRLLLGSKEDIARTNLLSHHVETLGEVERIVYRENVVKIIREKLKLTQWSEEDIFRYISIVRTNACAVTGGEGRGMLRMLHPVLATMNHSCMVNTRVFKREDHKICVRAQAPILEGQDVFLKYTTFFAGRIERSQLIQDNWNFFCECPRCSDPSDLKSNFDTLNCTTCKGPMLPEGTSLCSPWVCGGCGTKITREKVRTIENNFSQKALQSRGDLKQLEAQLVKMLTQFHTNHHLIITIKVNLILEYGKLMDTQAKNGKSWSLKQVRRKVDLCNQVLEVLNIIDKGLSETKSQIMYEMSAPQLMLLQYNLGTGKQELKEVKMEMESLIIMLRNVCENYEVFEEGREKEKLVTTKALMKDAQEFYKEAVISRAS